MRLPRADALRLAWPGASAHSAHVSMVTVCTHRSAAFSSALMMARGPVFTLLILHRAGRERLTRQQVAQEAIACTGVPAFLSDELHGRQGVAAGRDLTMLFAASLFSHHTAMTKPLIQRHVGVAVKALATLAGSPALVLLGLPAAWSTDWAGLDAAPWGLLTWASQVSAFLGWLVWG